MRCPFCTKHELRDGAWIDMEFGGVYKSTEHYDCANCGPIPTEHVDAVVTRIKELEARVVPEWISVDDRLPIDGELVVVFTPGDDGGPDFDFIEEGVWAGHEDHYQHFMAVGGHNLGGEGCTVSGPTAEAPYSHWMPLPAAPEVGE